MQNETASPETAEPIWVLHASVKQLFTDAAIQRAERRAQHVRTGLKVCLWMILVWTGAEFWNAFHAQMRIVAKPPLYTATCPPRCDR